MTVHEEQLHAHGGVRAEEDRVSTPMIVAVGVASLVVFIVAGGIVSAYFKHRMDTAVLPATPQEVGRSKIGLVEQQVYEAALRGEQDRAARLERLGSWGWVDRGAGVAHIPIDRAMQLVEQGVRAHGGAEQQRRDDVGGQP
jgi:hypothetical protein